MKYKIEQTDYAYIAGYIDGDGCFYIGNEKPNEKNKRLFQKPICGITIVSTNEHVLQSFKKLFKGSVNVKIDKHENWKTLYQYCIKKHDSLNLMPNILPYLVEKHDECVLAMRFATTNDPTIRLDMVKQMKVLKSECNLVSKDCIVDYHAIRSTIIPTEIDFAYLAGFIDAECCFNIQKNKMPQGKPNCTYKIQLQCNNTKTPVFKWLLERFGGSLSFINRLKSQKARKNQLKWFISGRALNKILDKIHPFLLQKQPVCDELIKFYRTTLPNGGARHTASFRTHYAQVLAIREEIVATIHKLNLKGINTI